jgi:hypothetical protein
VLREANHDAAFGCSADFVGMIRDFASDGGVNAGGCFFLASDPKVWAPGGSAVEIRQDNHNMD